MDWPRRPKRGFSSTAGSAAPASRAPPLLHGRQFTLVAGVEAYGMTEAPGAYAVRDVVDKRQLSSQQCSAAFTNDKREGHAPRMLVRDEPLASINTEALEGYVSGHFELQAEVKRFLASHPQYPRDRRDDLRAQRVTNLLKRPVYAGYVEARADWSSPKNKR